MKLTQPPFRADHVGSLLRPKELLRAREDYKASRIGAAQLKAIEDDVFVDLVRVDADIRLGALPNDLRDSRELGLAEHPAGRV